MRKKSRNHLWAFGKFSSALVWVPSETDLETMIQVHVFYMGGDPRCPERVPAWDREGEGRQWRELHKWTTAVAKWSGMLWRLAEGQGRT